MTRIFLSIGLFLGVFLASADGIRAAWENGDAGIQKFHQNSVPQITSSGVIQNSYTGDSYFPLFLYWYKLSALRQIKDAGFNSLFGGDWDRNPPQVVLDKAGQYGMKAYINLHDYFIENDVRAGNWNSLTSFVNSTKNHPATLIWWLTAENTAVITNAKWLEAYNVIKSLDPGRAVIGEQSAGDYQSPPCFGLKVDLSYIYSYTIRTTGTGMGGLVWALDGYMKKGCPWPLWVLGQAFYSKENKKIGGERLFQNMPSPAQIRAQMYTSILHGATGVGMFVGFLDDMSGQGEQLKGIFPGEAEWNAAGTANHEIEANKRVFLSKTSTDTYHVEYEPHGSCGWWESETCSNAVLHTMLKDTGEPGVRYLLAVNLGTKGANGRFSFGNKLTKVTSVFDNKTITPSDKLFTDSFPGYAAKLYRIETSEYQCADTNKITIQAAGTPLGGVYPSIALNIDGVRVRTFDGVSGDPGKRQFQTFSYCHGASVNPSAVKVEFLNDAYAPPEDRNVTVDRISIGGVDYQTESPATYSDGGWVEANGCAPGYKQTEVLACNGYFQYGQVNIYDLRRLLSSFTDIFDYNKLVGSYGK